LGIVRRKLGRVACLPSIWFPRICDLYYVFEWRNAAGVLTTACPKEWDDIIAVLRDFRLYRSEIVKEGGNRSPISQRLDGAFYERGWIEKDFATAILVDDARVDSPTHSVDCFKGRVAVEVEWNNNSSFAVTTII
jgi:hypothetical protein